MKDKVFIEIEQRKNYIGVGFFGKNYGAGTPCKTEKEIEEAIKHQKGWIVRERDIPFIRDLRVKQKNLF